MLAECFTSDRDLDATEERREECTMEICDNDTEAGHRWMITLGLWHWQPSQEVSGNIQKNEESGDTRKIAGVNVDAMWTIILSHANNWVHGWKLISGHWSRAGVISSILGMGDTKWIQHSWHSALQAINYVHYANINKSVRKRPDNKLDYILLTMSLLNSFYLMICGNFFWLNFHLNKMRHIRWGQNYHLVWTSNIIWQYFVRVFAGCCFWLIICKWCEKRENREQHKISRIYLVHLLTWR